MGSEDELYPSGVFVTDYEALGLMRPIEPGRAAEPEFKDVAIETIARAICKGMGVNPDALCFTEPTEYGGGRLFAVKNWDYRPAWQHVGREAVTVYEDLVTAGMLAPHTTPAEVA